MNLAEELPDHVVALMRSNLIASFVTVGAAGQPIDTPVTCFPGEGLRCLNIATGLSYPAKAERARRNPRVGLLLEGKADEPVIAIAGMAAVRDADLQRNADRYLAEAAYNLPANPDWALARQAVWYWTRIIVEIAPARIWWWDSPADMERAPSSWRAPEGTIYPPSDPAPPGRTSAAAHWQVMPWRDLAAQALARGIAAHLSVRDAEGFPLPARACAVAVTPDGFDLEFPGGIPWSLAGKACLTFGGFETFLGEARGGGHKVRLTVERPLPLFPMTIDARQLWEPTPDTRAQLMRRLETELQRRGQPAPTIPEVRPPPSEGFRLRMQRMGLPPVTAD